MTTFYLGTHRPDWLSKTDVPLFVSRRTIQERCKALPQRVPGARWALDSGGFTEIAMHGGWRTSVAEYVDFCLGTAAEIGGLDWVAPMDWMCEPSMVEGSGLSVREHQVRTIENFLELRALLGALVVPVLQGWTVHDYLVCAELYAMSGVDLAAEPTVGVGSVCRRGATDEVCRILSTLAELGFRLHAFGVKGMAYRRLAGVLASADSMAWSFSARHDDPLEGCAHRNCANCIVYALRWRAKLLCPTP